MTDYLSVPNDTYQEDIAVVAPGTVLVSRPCQVWQIQIVADIGQTGIVEFSDDATGYNNAHRKAKAYLSSGGYMQTINFPHGLNCTRGLSTIANTTSMDVFVSYD